MGEKLTRKGQKTKERIVDAAIKLFREEGLDNVPVWRICERAFVSNGSFFHYFRSKEEILYSVIEDESEELQEMDSQLDSLEPVDALNGLVEWQICRYLQKGSDFLSHFHSYLITTKRSADLQYAFVPTAARIIERGQREGVFRESLGPDFAAELLFVSLTNVVIYSEWPVEDGDQLVNGMVEEEYQRFLGQVLLVQ